MSKLLLDEHPMLVLPSLAVRLGVEGALMLQQIHYWSLRAQTRDDGRSWVYNTVRQWAEQFPFWSERTVRRILADLKESGVLDVAEFNASRGDRTPFYAINYETLEAETPSAQSRAPSGQNARMVRPERAHHPRELAASLITETTSETTTNTSLAPSPADAGSALVTGQQWQAWEVGLELNTGKFWRATPEQVAQLQGLYPAVDIHDQFRRMAAWLMTNSANRKTEKGILRFINTWLSRAQDSAPVRSMGAPHQGGFPMPQSKTGQGIAALEALKQRARGQA